MNLLTAKNENQKVFYHHLGTDQSLGGGSENVAGTTYFDLCRFERLD